MITMNNLSKVSCQCIHFDSPTKVNVVKNELASSPVKMISVDLSKVSSDDDLFVAIASALHFPDYFGRNWDALDECLTDMEWLPRTQGYVLFVDGAEALWKDAIHTAGKFVTAWLAASEQWRQKGVSFHLVFIL